MVEGARRLAAVVVADVVGYSSMMERDEADTLSRVLVKSNAISGLALGDADSMGWASFNGKATYNEPNWLEAEGNHEFTIYVEDWIPQLSIRSGFRSLTRIGSSSPTCR